ncbi:Gmad2 immunoglobulin-like domain-containing protein [Terrabacter sp. MAHUQ-38]|uniref:Gmad2 immunoglobulin-like domain-containing protein n=1 Tax=unclassified Terrabacter TaxID=2630222 RepID=UPI00165E94ED|nr:Gmad2 immunoglobulin-like domain-containing protein [Terrabacter sp. MAHUQ-38]MBC9821317.1 GerMN domain-containing protein [Terrabacter sp. MAHUQ-38]
MNTDPTRPGGQSPDEEPVVIGAGLRPVEDRLRRALDSEARRIDPTDRLGVILTEAHAYDSRGVSGRRRRWLAPAAAAAAAVLVAGTLWAVNRPSTQTPPVAATSTDTGTPSTSASTDTSSGSPSTSPSTVPTQTATGPTTSIAPPATEYPSVPVYYLGPVVAGSDDVRLFREFVRASATGASGAESKTRAALAVAMGDPPRSSSYVSAWAGVRPLSVSIDADRIAVTLSGGLPSGAPVSAELAVQQLVWTAQAAVGQGARPVMLSVEGGGELAPGVASGREHQRPSGAAAVYDVLSPIWVDEPARGAVVKAGERLTVKGVASTFEANVEWELLRDGQSVEKGFTTAAEAAPARAAYRFETTKDLSAGSYVLRVFSSSAKDGSLEFEQRVPFTAR